MIMKKIFGWLTNIASDKLLHAFVSCILYVLLFKIFTLCFGLYNFVPYIFVGALVLVIGFVKEYIDQKSGGIFDLKDLLADFVGILVGFLLCII